MSPMDIYLFTRLDAVHCLLKVGIIFGIFGAIIGWMSFGIMHDEGFAEKAIKSVKRIATCFTVLFILAGILKALVPTQAEMAAIYMIPKLVNNQTTQKIVSNTGDSMANMSQLLLQKTELWLKAQIPEVKK